MDVDRSGTSTSDQEGGIRRDCPERSTADAENGGKGGVVTPPFLACQGGRASLVARDRLMSGVRGGA